MANQAGWTVQYAALPSIEAPVSRDPTGTDTRFSPSCALNGASVVAIGCWGSICTEEQPVNSSRTTSVATTVFITDLHSRDRTTPPASVFRRQRAWRQT